MGVLNQSCIGLVIYREMDENIVERIEGMKEVMLCQFYEYIFWYGFNYQNYINVLYGREKIKLIKIMNNFGKGIIKWNLNRNGCI